MKVLVTGASGFVGSHLCDFLHLNGVQVFAQARSKSKFQSFNLPGTLILGDLAPTTEQFKNGYQWIEDQLPDDLTAVIHTAGIVHSFAPEQFYQINATATANLITQLKKRYKQLHFIFISSLSVLGPSPSPAEKSKHDEFATPSPITHYGHSKWQGEQALTQLAPPSWQKTIIRPPMVIGPRDPAILDIFRMAKSGLGLLAGKRARSNTYSFVCVHDLVSGTYKALIAGPTRPLTEQKTEIYHMAHPQSITYGELISKIHLKVAPHKKLIFWAIPIPLLKALAVFLSAIRKFYPLEFRLTKDKVLEFCAPAWTCNSQKSQMALGMKYHFDLAQTIEKTHADYAARKWLD